MTEIGCHATGYSFDASCPQFLYDNPNFDFVKADVEEPIILPFEDGCFDAVFSIGVLEHVHDVGGDQLRSMLEIHRILKSGGLFLCFVLPSVYSSSEWFARNIKKGWHHHSKLFTKADVSSLVEKSGFQLMEFGRYSFLPRDRLGGVHNRLFGMIYEIADKTLSSLLPIFCNQLYFIAKK